jgi:hypothetical protein
MDGRKWNSLKLREMFPDSQELKGGWWVLRFSWIASELKREEA